MSKAYYAKIASGSRDMNKRIDKDELREVAKAAGVNDFDALIRGVLSRVLCVDDRGMFVTSRTAKMKNKADYELAEDKARYMAASSPELTYEECYKKTSSKYVELKLKKSVSVKDMLDHVCGVFTYATSLLNYYPDGKARSAAADVDGDGVGVEVAREALRKITAAGKYAMAFTVNNRAHVWMLFNEPVNADDAKAYIKSFFPANPPCQIDYFPSGNPVRLPFAWHRIKGDKPHGVETQDGEVFDLSSPEELIKAMQAFALMPGNDAPPHAEKVKKERLRKDSDYAAAAWAYAKASRGEWLWTRSGRLHEIRKFKQELKDIYEGKRVCIRDGSDSEQVAALVRSLVTIHDGKKPAGVGAMPLDEIRSIALYLHSSSNIYSKYTIHDFKRKVDLDIKYYLPENYAPSATNSQESDEDPRYEALANHPGRGRPAGSKKSNLYACAKLLTIGLQFNRGDLAKLLTASYGGDKKPVSVKSVGRYLAELEENHGLRTVRGPDNTLIVVQAPRMSDQTLRRSDAAIYCPPGVRDNKCEGHYIGFEASQSGAKPGSITLAPPPPPYLDTTSLGDGMLLEVELNAVPVPVPDEDLLIDSSTITADLTPEEEAEAREAYESQSVDEEDEGDITVCEDWDAWYAYKDALDREALLDFDVWVIETSNLPVAA